MVPIVFPCTYKPKVKRQESDLALWCLVPAPRFHPPGNVTRSSSMFSWENCCKFNFSMSFWFHSSALRCLTRLKIWSQLVSCCPSCIHQGSGRSSRLFGIDIAWQWSSHSTRLSRSRPKSASAHHPPEPRCCWQRRARQKDPHHRKPAASCRKAARE